MAAGFITRFLQYFYPPFSGWMPFQTFRYAACGAFNTATGIIVFFVGYNFIFKKQVVHTPVVALSPHIAAMVLSFMVTFPVGFLLARYVVFSGSLMKKRYQLFRYFLTTMGSLVLNYINLKIMVDLLGWYPTIAQIINVVIVVTFSYIMQKYFAFRGASVN
ncbi:MAG TPA: GtrA family protein [Phnomibacter sp.]|nr:GtrA family protein [Phnomibacter sp.]